MTFDDKLNSKLEGEDGSFTDLRFVGTSASYRPARYKNVEFMTNSLLFWKDHESYKPTRDVTTGVVTGVSTTEKVDPFLGTEFNLMVKADFFENLTFSLVGAVFFPGGYYTDIRGIALPSALSAKLNGPDAVDLSDPRYGMSNDTAFFLRSGLEYRF